MSLQYITHNADIQHNEISFDGQRPALRTPVTVGSLSNGPAAGAPFLRIAVVIILAALISACSLAPLNYMTIQLDDNSENNQVTPPENWPNFPSIESAQQLTSDIDAKFLDSLVDSQVQEDQVQRLYDLFSWQTFVALNLPPNSANPLWLDWKADYEVFKVDGSIPEDWLQVGKPYQRTSPPYFPYSPNYFNCLTKNYGDQWRDKKIRLLSDKWQSVTKKPLWDQNGNPVYYEILLNEYEFDTIKSGKLYDRNAQSDTQAHQYIVMEPGDKAEIGSMEVKLAWKIIDGNDKPTRFFTSTAIIIDETGCSGPKQVGLVGMHISHKTLSTMDWIWATFEHVDNVTIMDEYKGQGLMPLFNDPDCVDCQPNTITETNGIFKTQASRIISLPLVSTAELNQQVRKLLEQDTQNNKCNCWQYYQLIGAQYALTAGEDPPQPIPPQLTNVVLETYIQETGCLNCHLTAPRWVKIKETGVITLSSESRAADFTFLLEKAQPPIKSP